MKLNLSLIGSRIAISGAILISAKYPIYGLILWVFSNIILGYVNRMDKQQLYMYAAYEIITLWGIYNYLWS